MIKMSAHQDGAEGGSLSSEEEELGIYSDEESGEDLSDNEPPIEDVDQTSGRPQSQFKLRVLPKIDEPEGATSMSRNQSYQSYDSSSDDELHNSLPRKVNNIEINSHCGHGKTTPMTLYRPTGNMPATKQPLLTKTSLDKSAKQKSSS